MERFEGDKMILFLLLIIAICQIISLIKYFLVMRRFVKEFRHIMKYIDNIANNFGIRLFSTEEEKPPC